MLQITDSITDETHDTKSFRTRFILQQYFHLWFVSLSTQITIACTTFANRPRTGKTVQKMNKIIFIDKAHFQLDLFVNKQNCHIW